MSLVRVLTLLTMIMGAISYAGNDGVINIDTHFGKEDISHRDFPVIEKKVRPKKVGQQKEPDRATGENGFSDDEKVKELDIVTPGEHLEIEDCKVINQERYKTINDSIKINGDRPQVELK